MGKQFIHIGSDVSIRSDEIVGIFDMDTATFSKQAREYLVTAQENGQITEVSGDLPKSFAVLKDKEKKQRVYLSPLNTKTIGKRAKNSETEF